MDNLERKSVVTESIDAENSIEENLIVKVMAKEPSVADFYPTYKFIYEGKDDTNAEAMIKSLYEFTEQNKELVLMNYTSKDLKAVQEGYSRAMAVMELFIRYLHVD